MIGTCAAHISCNLMVTQQIGRIIIELPLPGKCRSILNFFIIDEDVRPLLGAKTCQEMNLIKVMASDISESETVNAVNDKVQTAHIVLTRDQILKEYNDVLRD